MDNNELFAKAVTSNNLVALEKLLDQTDHTININRVIKEKYTALHWAVQQQRLDLVKLLLKYGANPGIEINEHGSSVLHLAATTWNSTLVNLLLDFIDVNSLTKLKLSPLHCAVYHNVSNITLILLNKKANVNAQTKDTLCTPLHYAVNNNNISLIEMLLRHGADPNIPDHNQVTPFLMFFYIFRYKVSNDMIELFLSCGARIDMKDELGNNALHMCAMFGTHEFLKKSLQMKMDINEKNNNDLTPLYCIWIMTEDLHVAGYELWFQDCTTKTKIFLKHMAILLSQKLYVNEVNMNLVKKCDSLSLLGWIHKEFNCYQYELQNMQETKVCLDFNITYYDLLVKHKSALLSCLKFKAITTTMNSGEYKNLFTYYSKELESNYLDGLKKLQQMIEFQAVLEDIFGNIFPYTVISKLCEFFNNNDYEACLKK